LHDVYINMTEITHSNKHHEDNGTTLFGFWVYLMTDLMMFAVLFATYAVLRTSTYGGPSGKELFNLPFVLVETFILLTSSFTMGLAMLGARKGSMRQVFAWLGVTLALGFTFLHLEISEFNSLIQEGHTWQKSAFLSSFFTLVGTHGLHILVGLVWIIILGIYISKKGLSENTVRKLTCLSMYWHFLDIVWIFIFTIVYLMGSM
jgi:cytochrome o ubiquinol oxidase subunit 3